MIKTILKTILFAGMLSTSVTVFAASTASNALATPTSEAKVAIVKSPKTAEPVTSIQRGGEGGGGAKRPTAGLTEGGAGRAGGDFAGGGGGRAGGSLEGRSDDLTINTSTAVGAQNNTALAASTTNKATVGTRSAGGAVAAGDGTVKAQ